MYSVKTCLLDTLSVLSEVADSPKYGVDCANKDTRFKMVQERKAEGLQRVNFTVPRDASGL